MISAVWATLVVATPAFGLGAISSDQFAAGSIECPLIAANKYKEVHKNASQAVSKDSKASKEAK